MDRHANGRPIASALTGWADHGHGSLSQRLAYALRRSIEAGIVEGGTMLPPERRLATELAVSRSTVTAALDLLRAEGLVESRQGRGTVVVERSMAVVGGSNRMADTFLGAAGGIDLAVGNPYDVSHLPSVSVDIAALLDSGAGVGFQPLGLPALRQAIAGIHADHGLHAEVDEIHVTSGCHQAIGLAIGALATPRDGVAVSMPCYPGLFDILGGLGNPIVPLRADASGILPESLDEVLREGRASVVYVQAGPHNPTGAVTPPQRLRALAAVLDAHDVSVVEDLTLADLAYDGRPALDLAHLCRSATVVSVGSFSKVLWGGLRVGWIRAPIPVVDRTLLRRLAVDLGPATPSQLLCLALLPHLAEVVATRRSFLEDNVRRGAALLAEEVPAWEAPVPAGGSVLWTLTPLGDTAPLVHVAHRHGVHVAPGSIAVEGQRPDPHLRICVDRPWPLVEAGLQRLGAAWRDLTRDRRRIAG